MRFWTAHLRKDSTPLLVREGFSWGALFFGPIWLALHRAWVPAAISVAAIVLILVLANGATAAMLMLALAVLLGLSGQDLRRWSSRLRGYRLTGVVAARREPDALARLLTIRPDLAGRFLPPEQAR